MARIAGKNVPQGAWALFEDLPAPACALDASGAVLFANARWREHFSDSDETLNRALASLLVNERSGARRDERIRLRDGRGRGGWYEVSARAVDDAGDATFLCVATRVDEAQRYDLYLELIAKTGNAFETQPDVERALAVVGGLLIPDVSEWFALYRRDAAGTLAPAFALHADTDRGAEGFAALQSDLAGAAAAARVALGREPVLLAGETFGIGSVDALLAPIGGRDRVWGVLLFANGPAANAPLGPAELRLAREIARRAGAAFENAALLESSERSADDLRFLADVGETMVARALRACRRTEARRLGDRESAPRRRFARNRGDRPCGSRARRSRRAAARPL
jgi:hypothetical protein